jgi:ubiquinone/menaquinone biosynthesis C-methylase UbiE
LKGRQQVAWSSGDYAVIGTTLQIVGESLCEACDIRFDERVLDVAAGNGNATLAAARRGAAVTSTDYVPALLERGAERAKAERLQVAFEVADAEALPYADGAFDVVLSTFGVMFAPDQRRAAHELLRVCKPGGRIALTSWTPEGFIGELLRMVGRHVPPAPGLASPLQWGSPRALAQLFGADVSVVHAQRKDFAFRYRSPQHFVDVFRRFYGPTHKAFEALDARGQAALAAELTQLVSARNVDKKGALNVPGEYLESVLELPAQ